MESAKFLAPQIQFFLAKGVMPHSTPQKLYIFSSLKKNFKVRWYCFPLATLTRGQPSGPTSQGHLAEVIGLLELHPVQRTSSDEPHFLYHPWALEFSTKKQNKKHFKWTSGSSRSSMPWICWKYILKLLGKISHWSLFLLGGVTKNISSWIGGVIKISSGR